MNSNCAFILSLMPFRSSLTSCPSFLCSFISAWANLLFCIASFSSARDAWLSLKACFNSSSLRSTTVFAIFARSFSNSLRFFASSLLLPSLEISSSIARSRSRWAFPCADNEYVRSLACFSRDLIAFFDADSNAAICEAASSPPRATSAIFLESSFAPSNAPEKSKLPARSEMLATPSSISRIWARTSSSPLIPSSISYRLLRISASPDRFFVY